MFQYPEEIKDECIKRRLRRMRWVAYLCGCKLHNVVIVPYQCDIHKKGVWATGPMFPYGESFPVLSGEPYMLDPRHVC